MAKLRMTYKNLKALRKSREYQAVIIDLVNAGILTKSKAEEMLEYNIPAALLGAEDTGSDTPIVNPDNSSSDDSSSSESEESSSSESDDSSSSSSDNTITITVSAVKTIAEDRLVHSSDGTLSSLGTAINISVPTGSSGAEIIEALNALEEGLIMPAYMDNASVEHYVAGFNPDTIQLYYSTDTFNEDTIIGVYVMPLDESSSS